MSDINNDTTMNSGYHRATIIAAIIASIAAVSSAMAGIAPWVMFIGWVAFFTLPFSNRNTVKSALCLVSGFLLGIVAAICVRLLLPEFGELAFAAVVFPVALLVVSLRGVLPVNNVAAWFLGLIAYFASHPELTLPDITMHLTIMVFGVFCGFITVFIQKSLCNE